MAKKKKQTQTVPSRQQAVHSPSRGAELLSSPRALIAILIVLSLFLYANTIGHDFVWDDFELIAENEALQSLDAGTIKQIFTNEFWPVQHRSGDYYRPFTTLTNHINYRFLGEGPLGFHMFNVFLNAIATALVFVFLYIFFGNTILAFVASVLFAVHPIHTENVAWVAGRTDILATIWMLTSLIFYGLFKRGRGIVYFLGSLVAFFLALLSKEVAACLPLVILLVELGPFETLWQKARTTAGRIASSSLVVGLGFFAVLAAYLLTRWSVLGTIASNHPSNSSGTFGVITLPMSVFAGYIFKILFPFSLNGEYDAPVPVSFLNIHVITGILLASGIVWLAYRYRRQPEIVLGTGIFLFGLAPAINIIPIGEISAERFLYFPSIGIGLIAGWIVSNAITIGFQRMSGAKSEPRGLPMTAGTARTIVMLFGILVLVFSGKTFARNRDWKNEQSFFTKTLSQSPNNPRAHLNMGDVSRRIGDEPGAIRAYEQAIALKPDYAEALSNLSGVYSQQGNQKEALRLMSKALSIWPDNIRMINNYASIQMMNKEYENAKTNFAKVLKLDPDNYRAQLSLGFILLQERRLADARRHLQQALRGGPRYYSAYFHLAILESEAGNRDLAKQHAAAFLEDHTEDDQLRKTAEAIIGTN